MLATQLVKDYGGSFAVKNLRRLVQSVTTFSYEQIVVSLIRQLSSTLHRGDFAKKSLTVRFSAT